MAHPRLAAVSIPGWITHRDHVSGELVATRIADLSAYQAARGCVAEIRAKGARELEAQCIAQSAYEVLLDRAELLGLRESADQGPVDADGAVARGAAASSAWTAARPGDPGVATRSPTGGGLDGGAGVQESGTGSIPSEVAW